ncbi:MAG: asparagine synthase (glutamine-hydrolyzing) [Alphaproteobacteria bacterium]|nr:asparagine synthase (glutamine-hydrolyzing) [Alphaproteobacteria bacterium]MBV9860854.1 asparagine synthase (glutamine-hydrolyzing) [Alphaproteobacteria bacterium]
MCGIAGIFEFGTGAPADPRLLARMTELIAHRGPDDSGHWVSGDVGLGHRRLSIIDISAAGHQPMASEDGTVWITYNGECYNYAELAAGLRARGHRFRSASDTEVILHLYQERGERFLDALDGMFALAIWDARKQCLLLARDRIGIKPLYYFADDRRLLFSSEMKGLLADPRVPTAIDLAALAEYFHLLSIPDQHCILRGVHKLPPGHFLKATRSGIERRQYWKLAVTPDRRLSLDEACEQFETRFSAAVTSHMVSDVPVGAFLSGGVDSSSIVAAGSRIATTPLDTFSITFPGLAEFDESPYAAAVAAHCGARHHEFALTPDLIDGLGRVVWHADEPFAISSAFALYYLAGLARRHVKVALSGDGGDEVFAGYVWRHVDFPSAANRARRTTAISRLLPTRLREALDPPSRDERYLRSFTCFQREELAELLQPELASAAVETVQNSVVQRCFEGAPGEDQLDRKLYTDIKTTLVSEMLTKVDRMTMAHGLEARVPFLDHHLVEWAFTVPSGYKLREREGKYLVKKAMERHLPHEILYRPKQGFNVPMKLWMRAELQDFVRGNLNSRRFAERGLYRPEAVAGLLDDHFTGRVDASNKIFALLMLELWFQKFVDQRRDCHVAQAA